jgi:hypothetical protein
MLKITEKKKRLNAESHFFQLLFNTVLKQKVFHAWEAPFSNNMVYAAGIIHIMCSLCQSQHCKNVKNKAVPLHAMKVLGGEEPKLLHILDLSTR